MDEVVLYPGSWLYNAGVVGFLKVVAQYEGRPEVESWLRKDGTIQIARKRFQELFSPVPVGSKTVPKVLHYYVDYHTDSSSEGFQRWITGNDNKGVPIREKYREFYNTMGDFGYKFVYFWNGFFASNKPFQNLVQQKEWLSLRFLRVLEYIPRLSGDRRCDFCGLLLAREPNPEDDLEERLFVFQYAHFTDLGPSPTRFPNAFWGKKTMRVCPLCVYLMLHRDLAFITLSRDSKIFINAPSFQAMWYLNNLVEELYSRTQVISVREIFGVSLIELALRLQKQLGMWMEMNVEVVSWQGNRIDFFALPYEVTHLLLDSEVARLLTDLREFSILRMVLDGRFQEILEVGERLLVLSLKPEWGENERNYVNRYVHLESNKRDRNDLRRFASSLFILYAVIQEKLGGGEKWAIRSMR